MGPLLMTVFFPNGIGGTLGSILATCKPLLTSGSVWYASSITGTDAASPAGQNREKPLLTIAQALTNSAAGDIIVLLTGSVFTLTGSLALAGRIVIGEGSVSGVPSVQIGMNGAGIVSMGTAGGELHNVRFTERSATSGGTARLALTASNQIVDGCYFDCGPNDDAQALSISSGTTNDSIRNCTFVSTATLVSAQPVSALKTLGTHTDLELTGCVFDAGTVGFSNYWALDMDTGIITRLKGTSLSFLRGADYRINASSTGYLNPQTTSGGVRGSW